LKEKILEEEEKEENIDKMYYNIIWKERGFVEKMVEW
jgi:hypothetical protein